LFEEWTGEEKLWSNEWCSQQDKCAIIKNMGTAPGLVYLAHRHFILILSFVTLTVKRDCSRKTLQEKMIVYTQNASCYLKNIIYEKWVAGDMYITYTFRGVNKVKTLGSIINNLNPCA
jgi:hypothetical protein